MDPICALATANGIGATALIRVSGDNCIALCDGIFKAKNKHKNLQKANSHTLLLGNIIDNEVLLDEVLVSVFKNPNSYTGEDVVEISCHGSTFIQQKIVTLLQKHGIRLAEAGEFTLRAYLNKKMDLSQAEAVADLIASDSAADHQLAIQQMRGGFSSHLQELRTELINFAALLELELDFSQEDVEFADRTQLEQLLNKISSEINLLIDSFSYGNVIKEGVPVAIAGKPNAGKSSLLNALFNEEKAIVSSIAGTTRDTIEDTLIISGIKFRFIDTAGLRETTDEIEKIGVQKAKEKVAQAKILLYLYDRNDSTPEEVISDVKSFHREDLITILIDNKIDQYGGFFENDFNTQITETLFTEGISGNLIGISTQNKALQSEERIKAVLIEEVEKLANQSNVVVSNSRHLEALQQTTLSIQKVQEGMQMGISSELIAHDIKDALTQLGKITGQVDVDQDILGTIFGKFCIGK